jgi:DNA-binding IclR family transcriptional regulator
VVSIQVLERAFTILDLLADQPLGLSEVARAVGLEKATTYNILRTLAALHALERTPEGKYRIGPRIITLAEERINQNALLPVARAAARQLSLELRETVVMSVLYNQARYIIAYEMGNQSVTVPVNVHERNSPYTAAAGWVLMAYLTQPELDKVIREWGFPGKDWRDIVTMEQFETELEMIRQQGWALDYTRDEQAVRLSMPVFDPDGKPSCAMGVLLPAARYTGKNRESIIESLKKAVNELEDTLQLHISRIQEF